MREDGYRQYYIQALKDASELKNGLKIITADWLAILKYIAGRQKDTDDILFLLKKGYARFDNSDNKHSANCNSRKRYFPRRLSLKSPVLPRNAACNSTQSATRPNNTRRFRRLNDCFRNLSGKLCKILKVFRVD